ncbi:hypothetical protein HPULCUR_010530 [Helicostylum pulchrum]|uniref:Formamidopyrimidine-DNA glycosylase catalytic domain-containing protein n=1 Tax=Helicostylum pulchrum TaxID=562976 RepID=A0ABP9YDH6_9FUNG
MPEIAEVEHARLRIHRQCLNHKVIKVEHQPDNIVYKDIEPSEFADTILNKVLVDTKRWGKYFLLIFDQGPSLVAHFGMTGRIRFQHEEEVWPPKFWKLLITFQDPTNPDKTIQFGFQDPRRLARLRLVASPDPLLEPPISKLGFDPVLNLPSLSTFSQLVLRRQVPIKALLLDQAFSAGVGNWVADEILYQAKIHPAQYSHSLTDNELESLYEKLKYVCETAVALEADESKFPADWLMPYRWNKGKKTDQILPNGLSLQFVTVGGRTSAIAPDIQVLRIVEKKKVVKKEGGVKKEEVENEKIVVKKKSVIVKKEPAVRHVTGTRRSLRIKEEQKS